MSNNEKISYLKYVRHHELPAWEAVGWMPTTALVNTPHGQFSTLCEWQGDGEPVIPVCGPVVVD